MPRLPLQTIRVERVVVIWEALTGIIVLHPG